MNAPNSAKPLKDILRDLKAIGEQHGEDLKPLTLGQLFESLDGRGGPLLAFILCLPFVQPIPVAGLASAFGGMITFIGIHLVLGRDFWLPNRLKTKSVSPKTLARMCDGGLILLQKAAPVLKPRLRALVDGKSARISAGIIIFLSGFLLALPLFIPFSNMIPSLAILFIALGILERDGLMVILGWLAFLVTLAFFGGLVAIPFLFS